MEDRDRVVSSEALDVAREVGIEDTFTDPVPTVDVDAVASAAYADDTTMSNLAVTVVPREAADALRAANAILADERSFSRRTAPQPDRSGSRSTVSYPSSAGRNINTDW